MNWTSEYPTEPGYYWVRNYQVTEWDELESGPKIAEIVPGHGVPADLYCYFTGSGDFFSDHDIVSAEWCGPIQPPANTDPGQLND